MSEPVAWAVVAENGQPLWLGYDRPFSDLPVNARTVPLYRHPKPALTDGEREAVRAAIDSFESAADFNEQRIWPTLAKRLREQAAALRGLLEEHKGEKNLNDAESEKMESIEIEVEKELLHRIMILAHEANVTLNKYIEVLLTDYLDELEREEAG